MNVHTRQPSPEIAMPGKCCARLLPSVCLAVLSRSTLPSSGWVTAVFWLGRTATYLSTPVGVAGRQAVASSAECRHYTALTVRGASWVARVVPLVPRAYHLRSTCVFFASTLYQHTNTYGPGARRLRFEAHGGAADDAHETVPRAHTF